MNENNTEYTPIGYISEHNDLVVEYAKLEERAMALQIERISTLLAAKALNDRHNALLDAQRKNNFSPDFCHMIAMLGHTDNVRALQCSYTPK